ncbi:MAG: hypothetical protein QM766_14575 [Burkholderiaceae bacterium]
MTLNDADARIVAREAALPGLRHLLDPELFAGLARRLAPDADIRSATLTYLRYKPETSAVAAFRLDRRDGSSLLVHAKANRRDRHTVASARIAETSAARRGGELAPCIVDPLQLVLLRPDDDRQLKPVRALLDPARRAGLLGAEIAGIGPGVPDIEVLRYKPGRRLVARVRHRGRDLALVRVVHRDAYGRALLGAALGAATKGSRLIRADAGRQLLVSAWTPGRVLAPTAIDGVALAGAALADLHRTRIGLSATWDRRDESRAVERSADLLGRLLPALADRARGLALRLGEALHARPFEPVPTHGDFSCDQVVVADAGCTLIDWDRAASADPMGDFGSFAARLEIDVLHGVIDRAAADAAIAALCGGYVGSARGEPPRFELHAAAALLRLATESFRRRLHDWPDREAALLDRVEALLARAARSGDGRGGHASVVPDDGGGGAGAGAGAASVPVASEDEASLLDHALDRDAMRAPLGRLLAGDADAWGLRAARLVRHKPGRRALIAYELIQDGRVRTLFGKMRFKGLDRHGYGIQRALAEAGFGADGAPRERGASAHESARTPFVVPDVVGCLPALNMWIQQAVPGTPSNESFAAGCDAGLARRVADALAALHGARIPVSRVWRIEDELAMLGDRLEAACEARADLAGRIRRVLDGCIELAARLNRGRPTSIHRDFHPEQVLVDGERLVLLDFDLFASGDPALDVGNFNAHLIELGVRRSGSDDLLRDHERAFVERYREHQPSLDSFSADAWTLISLARHIFLSLRFPDRRHTTEALVEACERRLGPLSAVL